MWRCSEAGGPPLDQRSTQHPLAARLGLHEQQIQRYEQNGYRGVSIERVQEIADTLGISFEERVEYNLGDDMPESEPPPSAPERIGSGEGARRRCSDAGPRREVPPVRVSAAVGARVSCRPARSSGGAS